MECVGLTEVRAPDQPVNEIRSPWDDPGFSSGHTDADPVSEIQRTFWLRHMRIGFGVFLAETILVMLYLTTTPHGPHRLVLEGIVCGWFVIATVGLLAAPRLASARWRVTFSASWTIASAVALGLAAALDGGANSPLLLLLFLPIGYATLAYTPAITTACGLSALGSMGVVELMFSLRSAGCCEPRHGASRWSAGWAETSSRSSYLTRNLLRRPSLPNDSATRLRRSSRFRSH
jgi:hypothetical protein